MKKSLLFVLVAFLGSAFACGDKAKTPEGKKRYEWMEQTKEAGGLVPGFPYMSTQDPENTILVWEYGNPSLEGRRKWTAFLGSDLRQRIEKEAKDLGFVKIILKSSTGDGEVDLR